MSQKQSFIDLILDAVYPQSDTDNETVAEYRRREAIAIPAAIEMFKNSVFAPVLELLPGWEKNLEYEDCCDDHYVFIDLGSERDMGGEAFLDMYLNISGTVNVADVLGIELEVEDTQRKLRNELGERLNTLTQKQLFDAFEIDVKQFALKGLTAEQLEAIKSEFV